MVSNLALFCLATYLDTFQKIGQLFPNHLVTLVGGHVGFFLKFFSEEKNRLSFCTRRKRMSDEECLQSVDV
jgi:hypothetical protein